MFFPYGHDFGWSADNFGATYSDAGLGINCPGNGSANAKGANTGMLVGLAEDCYGVLIGFTGGYTSGVARRNLVDLLIDPAAGVGNAGSSWSVVIANLAANGAAFDAGCIGFWYWFPLYLKAGTAIGGANQSSTTTATLRMMVRAFGKPKRIDAIRCGTKVQTYGTVIATTQGTAITPGSSAMGNWTASLGQTSFDQWWWDACLLDNDSSRTASTLLLDVAANATNKIMCAQGIIENVSTSSESGGKAPFGQQIPYKEISAGQDVYARAGVIGNGPNSNTTIIAYGLGG